MGSCVSLNYCNRGSRRSNHRTNESGEVRDVNQQQTNGQVSTSEQINLTVNTATASTVDSSRTTAGASACHRSPSFSNRTSNSFQSTCSTQRRNSSSLMNNAVITVNNNNNNNPSTNINTGGNNFHFIPPTGKNKRLKKDYLKYLKYDKRISESQLKAKREEFWDTAPAFDGKPEIWAALKAAVDALESKNYQLAQAIIDSANIILPNGFINDCYDELGNRYQLPVYVLVKPTHLRLRQAANEPDSNTSSSNKPHSAQNKKKSNKKNSNKNKRNKKHDSDDCDEDDDSVDASDDSDQNELDFDDYDEDDYDDGFFFRPSSKQKQANKGKKSNSSGAQPTTSKSKKENAVSDVAAAATTTIATSVVDEEPIQVKFRISTMNQDSNNSDVKLMVSLNETVLSVKKKLFEQFKIEPASQRFFFAGKLLKDKDKLRTHKLKKNVVVQVIVREQPPQQQQQQQPLAPPTTVEDKTQLNKCSTPTATTTTSS